MKVAVLLHSVPRRGKGGRCFKRPGGRLLVLIMPGSQFPVCVRLHGRAPYGYDEEADWDSHLSDVPSSQISSVDYLTYFPMGLGTYTGPTCPGLLRTG